MTKATTISSLCCAVLLLVSVHSFCPTDVITRRSTRSVVRASPDAPEEETATDGASNKGLARFFAFTAASVFALHPMATLAAPINAVESAAPFTSSSVQIAGAANSLDMSMPAYDTISAPKISSDDYATLSVAPVKEARSPAKSKSEPKSDSGFALPAFLPSMNKKGPADAAADKAEKKAAAADKVQKKAAVKKAAVPKVSAPTYDF